jgi:hypothetical protein
MTQQGTLKIRPLPYYSVFAVGRAANKHFGTPPERLSASA